MGMMWGVTLPASKATAPCGTYRVPVTALVLVGFRTREPVWPLAKART